MSLVIELGKIVEELEENIRRGKPLVEPPNIPKLTKEDLIVILEDAIMRAEEMGSEGKELPLDLPLYLSTLKSLIERVNEERYETVKHGAIFVTLLSLAILKLIDAQIRVKESYLDRIYKEVLKIAEKSF